MAKSAGESLGKTITRFGVQRGGTLGYLGLAFVIVATLLAVAAAGQVAATRDEEGEGHLDNLLVRPVARLPWLAGRLVVATTLLLAFGVIAGLFAWAGAATQQSGVSLSRLLTAGVATVPAAVFVLGLGTLAHSIAPRYSAAVAYAIVAGSFLLELVGSVINAKSWLLDLSVFHHLAPAPAADPNWTSGAMLVAVGFIAAAIGATVFERRDLAAA